MMNGNYLIVSWPRAPWIIATHHVYCIAMGDRQTMRSELFGCLFCGGHQTHPSSSRLQDFICRHLKDYFSDLQDFEIYWIGLTVSDLLDFSTATGLCPGLCFWVNYRSTNSIACQKSATLGLCIIPLF